MTMFCVNVVCAVSVLCVTEEEDEDRIGYQEEEKQEQEQERSGCTAENQEPRTMMMLGKIFVY